MYSSEDTRHASFSSAPDVDVRLIEKSKVKKRKPEAEERNEETPVGEIRKRLDLDMEEFYFR